MLRVKSRSSRDFSSFSSADLSSGLPIKAEFNRARFECSQDVRPEDKLSASLRRLTFTSTWFEKNIYFNRLCMICLLLAVSANIQRIRQVDTHKCRASGSIWNTNRVALLLSAWKHFLNYLFKVFKSFKYYSVIVSIKLIPLKFSSLPCLLA